MNIARIVRLGVLSGAGALIYRVYKNYQADQAFELAPVSNTGTTTANLGSKQHTISPELLEILACPLDKQPVELIKDDQGREWLLNPRNGYRYPVEDGIPIMLIEEGENNKDESLIRTS